MRAAMWTMSLCLALMSAVQAAENVTGTYKAQNGEVRVQQIDGRIKFLHNATYQTNVGEVSGEVRSPEGTPITSIKTATAPWASNSLPASWR